MDWSDLSHQKLRVGFFTYGMEDHLTGIGRYTEMLTKELKRLCPSWEIVLISPYPESPLGWYREFVVYPVPALKLLPSVLARGSRLLARAAQDLGLDVLHDPCGIAPFFGAWPERTRRIVTIHDAIPLHHPEYQPLLTRLVFRTFLPQTRRTADGVITVSHHAASDLVSWLHLDPERLVVTPLGVDAPSPDALLPSIEPPAFDAWGVRPPYFLFVGAVSPRKNLARLLQAFARVKAHHPTVQLVLAGPETAERTRLLRESGPLAKAVAVPGYVDAERLHQLYRGAVAVVYPSLYEGFGLPVLEAMAHGCPVITSNVSALPEVAGDAALLVDPTSADEIARAMEQVLIDPSGRQALIRKGRARAAEFPWAATAKATVAAYARVMTASAANRRIVSQPITLR